MCILSRIQSDFRRRRKSGRDQIAALVIFNSDEIGTLGMGRNIHFQLALCPRKRVIDLKPLRSDRREPVYRLALGVAWAGKATPIIKVTRASA